MINKFPEQLLFIKNSKIVQKKSSELMDGKICVISGATSGVGYEAVKQLAAGKANIVMLVRNEKKAKVIKKELEKKYSIFVDYFIADFSDLKQVEKAVKAIVDKYPRVDVLINSAGIYSTKKILNKDGYEMVFCVNHLAPFLITKLLLNRLIESSPSRIIQVNSEGHRFNGLKVNDLNWEKRIYTGLRSYGASKTAQLLTVGQLAANLKGTGVTINAMHPGGVKTNIGNNNGRLYRWFLHHVTWHFLKNPKISGEALYYLASASELSNVSGTFFNLTIEEKPAKHALDSKKQQEIWNLSLEMTGLTKKAGDRMRYDAVIVGGGIAGLTSAAFLTKNGFNILLCEKEDKVGGLASSFYYDGFLFDSGARGIIDSGIVKPMLKQLDINIEFVKSIVSIGIEKEMIRVETIDSLNDYREMLVKLYPDSENDIDVILHEIKKVMDYMDVLYGIENPLFKDLKKDKDYLFKVLFPWLFEFLAKSGKIKNFNLPVYDYLSQLTDNQSLIDIISQHFFQSTPASFALSYFSLYLDYEYPVKGTLDLAEKLKEYIIKTEGIIKTSTAIKKIDLFNKSLLDQNNQHYEYNQLIWAADTNQLYKSIDMETIDDGEIKKGIEEQKKILEGKRAGDSIYSLYLAVDLDNQYFQKKSSGHFFYTPDKTGQSTTFKKLKTVSKATDKKEIFDWMSEYLDYTTYEIAIPALRNEKLAPKGKTGLMVSVLMDYNFISNIKSLGFYEEFKYFAEDKMISVLDDSIYGKVKQKVIHQFSSSPLTIERLSGNLEGGITGWAFTNDSIPAITKMTKIKKTCNTPIPDILQAGQWTFSPSGLPISILTGKIAADKAVKILKKGRRQ